MQANATPYCKREWSTYVRRDCNGCHRTRHKRGHLEGNVGVQREYSRGSIDLKASYAYCYCNRVMSLRAQLGLRPKPLHAIPQPRH